jgi:predicted transcriptional regulator
MSGHRKKNPHKALMHPLRVDLLLRIIQKRLTSPNQLSQEIDMNLNLVAYHVRILEDYDAITLVETKQRRGAQEHFYSVKPESEVLTLLLGRQMSTAARSAPGDFLKNLLDFRKDGEVSIATALPVLVDPDGIEEIRVAASELTDAIRSAEEASKKRAPKSNAKPTLLTLGILAFPLMGYPSKGP